MKSPAGVGRGSSANFSKVCNHFIFCIFVLILVSNPFLRWFANNFPLCHNKFIFSIKVLRASRISVDFTDDEEVQDVSELPSAISQAEDEESVKQKKKKVSKKNSKKK